MKILSSGTMDRSYGAVADQKEYESWYSMNTDFVFFNPGMLYWHTPLNRDIISDFITQNSLPKDQRPTRYTTQFGLYEVNDPIIELTVKDHKEKMDISRMLYCCPNVKSTSGEPSVWDKLDAFITSIAFSDMKTGYLARAVRQSDLEVLDYPALQHGIFSPVRIKVAAWGLYSNEYTTLWRTAYDIGEGTKYKRPVATKAKSVDVLVQDGIMFFKEIR